MADRALSPGQIQVLTRLQQADLRMGLLSGCMVPGRRADWARPKLEALARRGFVVRSAVNVERWHATAAGLAVILPSQDGARP